MKFEKFSHKLEPLTNSFSCGNTVIDKFLKSGDALDRNQGITYILLSDDSDFIVGYYNISVGRVDRIEVIGDKSYYIPMGGSVNINYLAVDVSLQHTPLIENKKFYYGDYILRDCERKILQIRKEIGIAFVTLYSTKEGYHLYHERNGFENFEDDMSTFVQESDNGCYKLYKCVDDIIGA